MIGSIRKHSSWLWWIIAALTILSFVIFMGNGGMRNSGARGTGYGVIYGQPVTAEEFDAAERMFAIDYLRRSGQFPGRYNSPTVQAGAYYHLMLMRKAASMNIHVSDDSVAEHAQELLRQFGNGRPIAVDQFVQRVLMPEQLSAADFQKFSHDDLVIQMLIETFGLSGALLPPQEASQLYDHDHQDVSTEAVFFSATNFLSQVTVTTPAVHQFYTNNMAAYRLPDRVQINYAEFELTNYLSAAEKKLSTNLTELVEANYTQHAAELAPEAKTPEEAKAKIKEYILRQTALGLAAEAARQFESDLFSITNVSPETLLTLAKEKHVSAHATAPFTEEEGPQEFPAPEELTKMAFKLNPESPFAPRPIAGAEAVYVVGLAKQLPSSIPPLDEIRPRVIEDYQHHEAAMKARAAGTNFYNFVTAQMFGGKTFAQAAIADRQTVEALKPFSLSSQTIPEAEGHADPDLLKRAAFFDTQPGHLAPFVPTADGGFVLFVKSLLPVDETLKKETMPRFLAQLRRQRMDESFEMWLNTEATRELGPILKQLSDAEQKSGAQQQ